jgi:hypothetical protein
VLAAGATAAARPTVVPLDVVAFGTRGVIEALSTIQQDITIAVLDTRVASRYGTSASPIALLSARRSPKGGLRFALR